MTVAPVREFWDRKVDKALQMFEYGAWDQDKFVDEMSRLGFDKNYITETLNE
jgi:hypothetical protein|tara:strand:- start:1565 stop:1720 length:156 start_codon:yes stop_codon:yes gene_type:complete